MSVDGEKIRKAEQNVLIDHGYTILCEDYMGMYVCESPRGDLTFTDTAMLDADQDFCSKNLTGEQRQKYERVAVQYLSEFADDTDPARVLFAKLEIKVISESTGFVRIVVFDK